VTSARRNAARIAIATAVLGAASTIYQQIADREDRRRFPPPGHLVDIGGRRLHALEAGDQSPAIVIIPAVGGGVLEWLPTVRKLAALTRVYVYDRAEIGWSDPPGRSRRTIDGMAADLHALLTADGITAPYILAGHSLGGVIARRFIADHPDAVCGLLLVDSSHEDQVRRFGERSWRLGRSRYYWWTLQRQLRILGARRLAVAAGLIDLGADVAGEFPPDFADTGRAYLLSTRRRRVGVREPLILTRPQQPASSLGDLPLTVLTAAPGGEDPRWREEWEQLQAELAGLSTNSRHVQASHAGHYIHLEEPEAVVDAARELLKRCLAALPQPGIHRADR
jgi:pimeloyl-ACP methyl ester carboxylesterase